MRQTTGIWQRLQAPMAWIAFGSSLILLAFSPALSRALQQNLATLHSVVDHTRKGNEISTVRPCAKGASDLFVTGIGRHFR